ncbi:hypothetical protein LTR29_015886 [Friedmanniomyces endolithicus]|nr:hypothetical protein LTR29_015886 [Friedmanniomyces endolithicus]
MSTTKSDRERMAALGARLMGSNIASTPSAPPSATAPRSMPTAAKSINRENMPLFTRPVPPEVRITPPVKRVEPASTTKMASVANESATNSTSVLHERKLNVPETSAASSSQNSSPSPVVGAAPSPHTRDYHSSAPRLAGETVRSPMAVNSLRKGDVDALKVVTPRTHDSKRLTDIHGQEAREFAQSISPGKGTPSHGHKPQSSTRRSVAREMYAATSIMAPASSPKSVEARKPVAAEWQDFASAAATRRQISAVTKNVAAAAPVIPDVKLPEAEEKEKPIALPEGTDAGANDISQNLAPTQPLPPHLRKKIEAAMAEPEHSAALTHFDSAYCAQIAGSSACIMSDLTLGIIVAMRRDLDALVKRVAAMELEKGESGLQSGEKSEEHHPAPTK